MSVSAFDELISTGEIVDPVLLISRLIEHRRGFSRRSAEKSDFSIAYIAYIAYIAGIAGMAGNICVASNIGVAGFAVGLVRSAAAMPHRRPRPPNHCRY